MSAAWFLTDAPGGAAWALTDEPAPEVAADAPSAVAADATGATTSDWTWTPALTGGTPTGFELRYEAPTGSGNYVAAVLAASAPNPTGAGVTSATVIGQTPAMQVTPQVRALRTGFSPSAWTSGPAFYLDNSVEGGGGVTVGAAVTVAAAGVVTGAVSIAVAVASAAVSAVVAAAGSITGTASATATIGAAAAAVSVAASGQVLGTAAVAAAVQDAVSPPAPAPVSVGGVARVTRWADKDPRESFTISFTFPGPPTDIVMTVDVYSPYGESDANPESIFNGSYVVNGNVVARAISRDAGVDLVDYYIDCVATVSGERLVSALVLPVRQK